ncbi:MAG: glycosyltransferase family 9 protein [Candidatus Omnitrophica bacterium]|nr:glycosyltransferase family 9 protein [Candidatus Omnitrophota bacterium]MCM8810121.1 glycosyltransferase family 9 protein [Candidatus Omnitrophota bacterium]
MKKVLIIREGALGDLVLTFPVFYNFKKNGFKVFIAGKGIYKGLVEKIGYADNFIPIDSYEYLFLFENDNKKLKNFFQEFDIIVAYINEEEILGINIKKFFKGKVFFHPIEKEKLNIHITDYLLQPLTDIFNQSIINSVSFSLKRKGEFFVIHPGSGSKNKNWPKEKFLELIENLKNVKLILGPAEQDEVEFWRKNFKGEIFFNIDIDNILKIAEKTTTYIGNDSGFTHLFSFLGVKTIAIFGPTSPFIWGPRGENVKIVYKKIECSPCKNEKMKNCKYKYCLEQIKVEDIVALL